MMDLADLDRDNAGDHLRQAMVELTTAQEFLTGEEEPLQSVTAARLMERLQRQGTDLDGT